MGFFNLFKGTLKKLEGAKGPDPLFLALKAAYPEGPIRRGSLKSIPRHLDLTDSAPVIDEVLIFDADDHWFYLFLGCGSLGLPFELSLRVGKIPGEATPPDWMIEPVTRVANGIGDGDVCAPGVTWVIGAALGNTSSPYVGFLTLPDLQFGNLQSDYVLQLVLVTRAELELRGGELEQLCDRLEADRSRMVVPGFQPSPPSTTA